MNKKTPMIPKFEDKSVKNLETDDDVDEILV